MTFEFNSRVLPHPESGEPFGFVQTGLCIDDTGSKCNFEASLSVCRQCSALQFPCEDGTTACPMCSPERKFKDEVVCFDSGVARRGVYIVIVDMALPIAKMQEIVSGFGKALEETDVAVVIAVCGDKRIVVYAENNIPFFDVVEAMSEPKLRESSKNDVLNVIVPCLPSLYAFACHSMDSVLVDVLSPIDLAVKLANKRSFAIFWFLGSQTKPMTVQKVAALSKIVATRDGVVHFGATEQFKRLTAIARHSMGCVFGLGEFVPSTFRKLMTLSKPVSMYLYCPRYIEISKVTGSEGSLRSNRYLTILQLAQIFGGSVKMQVDFERIDARPSIVRFLEVTTTVSGKYARLHTFEFADTPESFRNLSDADITQNIKLKGLASDILRAAWAGEAWESVVKRVLCSEDAMKAVKGTIMEDLGQKPDRDALRLYYVLQCMCAEMESKIVTNEHGTVFLVPPVAYVCSPGDAVSEVERVVESDWPFEVRAFTDMNAFKLLVEKFGKRIE